MTLKAGSLPPVAPGSRKSRHFVFRSTTHREPGVGEGAKAKLRSDTASVEPGEGFSDGKSKVSGKRKSRTHPLPKRAKRRASRLPTPGF
jgi:hypothetical protein